MSIYKSDAFPLSRVLRHIVGGKPIAPPITFQLLSLQNVSDKDENGNITTRKYFLELSDGENSFSKCLIDNEELCNLVVEEKLACCSIIRIQAYRIREIHGERILHLDRIERLVDGNTLFPKGNPKEIDSKVDMDSMFDDSLDRPKTPPPSVMSIQKLATYPHDNWIIRVCVFEKIAKKVIKINGNFYEYFQISGIDKERTKIEILARRTEENVEKFYEPVQINSIYHIANGKLRRGFNSLLKYFDVDFFIELKSNSIVDRCLGNDL